MPEEYKMELPEDVKVTITDILTGGPEIAPQTESGTRIQSLPNVCDPADDTICDSCA